MSTTAPAPTALDVSATPPVPFGRLVSVELRKALDTRAGRWFTGSILALCLVVVVIYALAAPTESQSLGQIAGVAGGVLGYFLPVLVILMLTSEWSQRTGLVTFTLEPRRPRVIGAKLVAALLLGIGLIVVALVIAVLGNLIGGGDWSVEARVLINGAVVANLIAILTGFAIGMLLMNTPAAIVTYFIYTLVLPTAVGVLSALQDWFDKLAPWIEFNTAQQPLFMGDYRLEGQEWAQFVTAGLIWLVLPFVLGLMRLLRAEPK
ncbi:hypothetical protein GCM10011519_34460 [Marmoricola endophyticus]|uniref:Uncharacterized protein n=1 Tax=Marmoricola endophyticus TaxID=2040280 RepID=A0A917F8E5_9ACTN|nr:ABC transporter permease [Marmoricola endophyticus]GGF57649.1 hypothetical protein GCM10011519_34460 [Marmoricola endophyticus]